MHGAGPADEILLRKLRSRGPIDADDAAAIAALPLTIREIDRGSYLLREGGRPTKCAIILDGLAFRQKLAVSGERQIVAILVPGDFTDLQQLFLPQADHNVQAMTPLRIAEMQSEQLQALALERPAVTRALWLDTLIEASIAREALLNIGQRDAAGRLSHFFCEFAIRLAAAGLAREDYDLPMTQEQIGDALALTAVHVNRTLKLLTNEGLIARDRRRIRIVDWHGLKARADYSADYLHLPEGSRARDRIIDRD